LKFKETAELSIESAFFILSSFSEIIACMEETPKLLIKVVNAYTHERIPDSRLNDSVREKQTSPRYYMHLELDIRNPSEQGVRITGFQLTGVSESFRWNQGSNPGFPWSRDPRKFVTYVREGDSRQIVVDVDLGRKLSRFEKPNQWNLTVQHMFGTQKIRFNSFYL